MSIMELISSVVPLGFPDVFNNCICPAAASSEAGGAVDFPFHLGAGGLGPVAPLSHPLCHWRSNCWNDNKMGKLHITDISSDFLDLAQWKCAFIRLFCDYSNYIHVKNPSLPNQSCQTSAEENERNTCANVHLFCSKWKSWMTLPLMNPKLSFRYPPS